MKLFSRNKSLFKVKSAIIGMAVFEYSSKGKILHANKEFYNIIGYTEEEFIKDYSGCITNIMSEADSNYALDTVKRQLENYSDLDFELVINKKDGTKAYLYLAGQVVHSPFSKKKLWCIIVDITHSRMANKQLLQINMDLDRFVSNLPGGAYRFSYGGNGEFDFISRGMYELFSHDRALFRQKTENRYINIIHPEDREWVKREIEIQIKEHGIYDVEYKIITNNNEPKWVADRGQVVWDNNGDVWICGIITDITGSKKQQMELELSREKYHIVSDLLEDILFDFNIGEDTITFSNRFLEKFQCEEIVKDCVEFIKTSPLIFDEHRDLLLKQFDGIKQGSQKSSAEILLKEKREGFKWYNVYLASIHNDLNRPLGAVGKLTCIHEQKKELERLLERANLDALTGLYNKGAVKVKIEERLLKAEKDSEKCALMIIDIDNFKAVNDNQGHLFGDAILTELSTNLIEEFSEKALIGRIGGDEFIMLVNGFKTLQALKKTASKICQILSTSHAGEERNHLISGSVGISLYPEHGLTYEELFKNADIALYSAKNKGKNRFEIYSGNAKSPMGTIVIDLNNDYQKICAANGSNSAIESAMLSYLFASANGTGDINSGAENLLSKIGEHYLFERILVFRKLSQSVNRMELIYEWHDKDISPLSDKSRLLKITSVEKYKKLFDDHGFYESSDLSELPVTSGLKSHLKTENSAATVHLATYEDSEFSGAIIVVRNQNNNVLSVDEKDTLFSFRKLIENYISKISQYSTLVSENKNYAAIMERQGLCCYTIDPLNHELISIDRKTKELFPDAEVGEKCYMSFYGKKESCKNCPIHSLGNKSYTVSEIYNESLNAWLSIAVSKMTMPNGKEVYSMCCSNITNLIERINTRDSLTGLPSITAFTTNAEKILKSYPDKNYAIVCMDIDKFKYINETAGTPTGDKILISVSNILSSLYYYDELICRNTADKFILLLRYTDLVNFEKRLTYINQKLNELQQNEYKNIKITVISGIYLVGNDQSSISIMIDKANVARRVIRGSHKNDYYIYNDQLHNLVTKEKDIESRMQNALENHEFVVYLQPKKDLVNDTIYGAEALVRWNTGDESVILPNEFVPLFEKNGFVVEMDFYVYEEVFKTIRHWIDEGMPVVVVSVNVSRLHLINKDFVFKIKELMSLYLVPPRLIELELTESIFIDYGDYLFDTISQLKAIGFSISIDDFGSGYSSLNLLKDLPVDVIKLDKSFFPNETIGEKEKIVVSNIIKLAKDLCIKVIAEGVESKEHADFLREIGCDMAQGYYCGKASTIKEFEKLLKKNKNKLKTY